MTGINIQTMRSFLLLAGLLLFASPNFGQKPIKKPVLPNKNTTTTTPSKPSRSYINGHEYVDIGLSVKWATCNVGASSPSEYGDYFAWGETQTKSLFVEDNSAISNRRMPDIAGNAKYDAARSNWGGSWRLPTSDELDELISKCKREWTAMGGVNGYKVTGPNGKSIFLPASGCYKSNTLGFAGGCAVYWTSTPYEKGTQNAYGLIIVSDGFERSDVPRYCGVSVRPVSD